MSCEVDCKRGSPTPLEDNVREAISLLNAIEVGRFLAVSCDHPERRIRQEVVSSLLDVTLKRLRDGLDAEAGRQSDDGFE